MCIATSAACQKRGEIVANCCYSLALCAHLWKFVGLPELRTRKATLMSLQVPPGLGLTFLVYAIFPSLNRLHVCLDCALAAMLQHRRSQVRMCTVATVRFCRQWLAARGERYFIVCWHAIRMPLTPPWQKSTVWIVLLTESMRPGLSCHVSTPMYVCLTVSLCFLAWGISLSASQNRCTEPKSGLPLMMSGLAWIVLIQTHLHQSYLLLTTCANSD